VGSTGPDGSFAVDHFAYDGFVFLRNGYENASSQMPDGARLDETFVIAIRMQPKLVVAVGSELSSVISPDDVTYMNTSGNDGYAFADGDYRCSPCKLVSLTGTSNGVVLRLSWSGSPLAIWAGSNPYGAPTVTAVGHPGQSELTILLPPAPNGGRILVGIDPSAMPDPDGAVAFKLRAEMPQLP
jgi:hypothetical protein